MENFYMMCREFGYESARLRSREDSKMLRDRLGTPLSNGWIPVAVDIIRTDEEGQELARTEFPWISGGRLVARSRGQKALAPIVEESGEWLPLDASEPLWLFNAWVVVDALDVKRSIIGKYSEVKRYALRPEAIDGIAAFKCQAGLGPLIVSQSVVDGITAFEPHGLEFFRVWPDAGFVPPFGPWPADPV